MDFIIKRIAGASLAFLLFVGLIACSGQNEPEESSSSGMDTTTVSPGDTTITTTDTIRITWSGQSAAVTGSHSGVEVTPNNGYVTINSTVKDISYVLSGTGQGQLTIYGTNRHQLILSGLNLTCSDGPAINNQCKKSCFVLLQGTNSLTDGSSYASSTEDRKAAFFSEGQMIFSGAGSLTVKGNYKHAIASDDYIQFAESTGQLTLTASADGIHANDGVYFDGGEFTITAGNDGVQCDSIIIVNGGSLNITATDKGITDSLGITIGGGTIRITSEYKCIKTKGDLYIKGGDTQVICTGAASSSGGGPGGGWGGSSSSSSPEGIEAKGTITITGGKVYSQSADDAINSGGDLTISGGYVCAYSTGNDGIDANGNCYIKGGVIYAIGASDPEVAIDANTEERKTLYIQGGTIIALGKLENGASISQTCYQSSSWNANTWYSITVGDETFAFQTPAKTSSSGGGGHGPGGGSSQSTKLVVSGSSKPTVKSGVTVSNGTSIFNGMGSVDPTISGGTSVSLSSYSNSGW